MKIYRDGDKLVKDTGKAPPQFSGVLSIVYAGTSPETVEESVYPSDELRALPEANKATLSPEWKEVFGLPSAESKSATGRQSSQPPERRATVDEEIAPSPLADIWACWPLILTPMVVVWLPFALLFTMLHGANEIFDFVYDALISSAYALCASALTALALCAYTIARLG